MECSKRARMYGCRERERMALSVYLECVWCTQSGVAFFPSLYESQKKTVRSCIQDIANRKSKHPTSFNAWESRTSAQEQDKWKRKEKEMRNADPKEVSCPSIARLASL